MRTALERVHQWPGNPFEHMDLWAFSLRKWAASLALERNSDGTLKYQDLSPVHDQASACGRVSGLVRDLLKAV